MHQLLPPTKIPHKKPLPIADVLKKLYLCRSVTETTNESKTIC